LFYLTLGVAIVVYVLIRYIVRTPFGLTLQGVRDEPVRMSSLGSTSRSTGRSPSVSPRSSPRSPESSTRGGAARSLPATPISRRRSTSS